jgi:hypothetical protein
METREQTRLLSFLREELSIPTRYLELALRQCQTSVGSLPIVLWQYGFIDTRQLEQVMDWLDMPSEVEFS